MVAAFRIASVAFSHLSTLMFHKRGQNFFEVVFKFSCTNNFLGIIKGKKIIEYSLSFLEICIGIQMLLQNYFESILPTVTITHSLLIISLSVVN